MTTQARTVAFEGLKARVVDVQVSVAGGLPAFTVVGLADKAVAESRERVRAALRALGLALPARRLTVNLAPADMPKEGSHYDLPIALGVLAAMNILPEGKLAGYISMGELSLDGSLAAVSGILPAALAAVERGFGFVAPAVCGPEAAWAGRGAELVCGENLLQLINHFQGKQMLAPPTPGVVQSAPAKMDLGHIRGQESARRALEVAAAGGHNILFMGPPGSGKSLLASCLPGVLPPLGAQEILEVSQISSVAGHMVEGRLCSSRPFRNPHHSASMPSMVGGGTRLRPGEVSLAHRGVLFLDELAEFPRGVLEALREPLETGEISVARVHARVVFPARFQLIAAMNPCACGYAADEGRACGRVPHCVRAYRRRLSGPLLDRIDLFADVPPVPAAAMLGETTPEKSDVVAARVAQTQQRQHRRTNDAKTFLNAHIPISHLEKFATLDKEGQKLLQKASQERGLSARGYHRVLRVARTIADMEGAQNIVRHHLAEALSYRPWLDRSDGR